MIALNETNEYAAEVPFTLPLESDPLTGLTGWAFTLGEVKIRLPGSLVWIDVAVNKIVEKGYGRFCARLTSTQTTVPGTVSIRAAVADTQPYFGTETISVLGGDIAVLGTGYLPFFLPDSTDPVYGSPIDNADFTTSGMLRICLPDGLYRDATAGELASIVNLGYGGYALPIDDSYTAKAGKIFIYVTYPGAQRFEDYTTILGIGLPELPVEVPIPIRFISDTVSEDIPVTDFITRAVNRLCEYSRSGNFEPDTYSEDGFDFPFDEGMG